MSINTRSVGGFITPLAGYKLVITIMGESFRVSAKRKLKKEMNVTVHPIIEHREDRYR